MGLLGSLFGGSKSKSGNHAYEFLSGSLQPSVQASGNMFNQLADTLGKGFGDYKNNAGFNFLLNKGTRDIAGGAAAKGLLNSGSTAKSLAAYESNLGNTFYNNYLDKISQAIGLGNQRAGVLAEAGSYGSGKSN